MKIRARLVLFTVIAASLLSVVVVKNTNADDLTPAQTQLIEANCLSILGSLNQLHASDALLRVNRGQIYESVGTRLMGNFNARLANNKLDNRGLVVVSNQYEAALTQFRSDYLQYEQQLSATLKIDCTTDPIDFNGALEDARTKRDAVHTDVQQMNQYIDDYRSAVNDFMLNFDSGSGKN
jgi:hypothetical protein